MKAGATQPQESQDLTLSLVDPQALLSAAPGHLSEGGPRLGQEAVQRGAWGIVGFTKLSVKEDTKQLEGSDQ